MDCENQNLTAKVILLLLKGQKLVVVLTFKVLMWCHERERKLQHSLEEARLGQVMKWLELGYSTQSLHKLYFKCFEKILYHDAKLLFLAPGKGLS
jgi:hypothetical protein